MSLPHPTPIRAAICLMVGAVLWPAESVEAQARGRRGVKGPPSVVAELVAGSLARSTEELTFRITVEVPAGHHGYIDRGDDGFFIPFSFSLETIKCAHKCFAGVRTSHFGWSRHPGLLPVRLPACVIRCATT